MELYITNGYSQTMKYPIFMDIPYEDIKSLIWYYSSLKLNNENNYRFMPQFIQIKMVYKEKNKKQVINAESITEMLELSKFKTNNIPLKDKIIFSDPKINNKYFYFNDKKYNLFEYLIIQHYTPVYLYELLENNGVDNIDNVSFYFESVIDFLEVEIKKGKNPNFESVSVSWPSLTTSEFEDAIKYIQTGKINKDIKLTTPINKLKKYVSLYNEYLAGYLKSKITDYLIYSEVTLTKYSLSKGDIGNNYIELDKIFRNFPTSKDIPFIALNVKRNIKIKTYDKFDDIDLLEEWSLKNRSAKETDSGTSETSIMDYKDLTFKLKEGEIYSDVTITAYGKITIQCKQSKKKTMDNFLSNCSSKIKLIIDFINSKLPYVFKNEPNMLSIDSSIGKVKKNINVNLTYNSFILPSELSELANNNEFVRDFILSDLFHEYGLNNNYVTLISKNKIQRTDKLQEKMGLFKGEFIFTKVFQQVDGSDITDLHNDYELTIKNNPKYENSGLVEITGIKSIIRLEMVKYWLNYIIFLSNKTTSVTQVSSNRNRALKNISDDFNSRTCQKNRQPIISNTVEVLPGSYHIEYNGNRIVCDKQDYPYPGVNSQGSFCCFKRDQRKQEKYINKMKKETNFLINPTNLKYNGYPIFLLNDILYYSIDGGYTKLPESQTSQVFNQEKKVNENDETYFFPEVSFNNIINLPSSSVCHNIEMDSKKNLKCPNNMFLGFNNKGFPCCYTDQPKKTLPKKNTLFINLNSVHQITKDKILNPGQVGIFPKELQNLFDELNTGLKVFRYGVIQNYESFINAVSFSIDKKVSEIKKNISEKLNYGLFISLENGDLSPKFQNNIKEYKKFLNSKVTNKTHEYVWDLISYTENIEIIIVDYETRKLLCHTRQEKLKFNKPVVFIIKIKNNYEPVIFVNQEGSIQKINLDENSIINDFYNYLCSPKEDLKIDKKDIKYQILDTTVKNRLRFLITNDNFYIPVEKNTGPLPEIPIRSINKRKPDKEKIIQQANTKYKNYVKIIGQVTDIYKPDTVIGLMTDKDIIIPVRNSKINTDYPISFYKYLQKAEDKFSTKLKKNEKTDFLEQNRILESVYHLIKYNYSQEIQKELSNKNKPISPKEYISNVLNLDQILSDVLNKSSLYKYNDKDISFYKEKISKTLLNFFIGKLEQELENNPDIIDGKVDKIIQSETFDEDQIVLTHIDQILKYLKKRKDRSK